MTRLSVLTTAATDLLALAEATSTLDDPSLDVTARNVLRLEDPPSFVEQQREASDVVVARLIGGRDHFPELVNRLVDGAEAGDFELVLTAADGVSDGPMRHDSTLSVNRVRRMEACFEIGGVENFRRMLRMVLDGTKLEPVDVPAHGIVDTCVPDDLSFEGGDFDAALLVYRALYLSGDLGAVRTVVERFRRRGLEVLPVFCPGVRDRQAFEAMVDRYLVDDAGCPQVEVVLSMLGFSASDPGETPPRLEALDVPWIQLIDSAQTVEQWSNEENGLLPRDRTMKVTLAEFDGRLIGPPVSFRRRDDGRSSVGTSLVRRCAVNERVDRAADWTRRWTRLRSLPNRDKRVAIVLGQHPVDRGRIGSAVGLDTPSSLIALMKRLEEAGFTVESVPMDEQALMDQLAGRAAYGDEDRPPADPAGRVDFRTYRRWLEQLPEDCRRAVRDQWGDPSADRRSDTRGFPVPGRRYGNLFVGLQPPRGYGQDPEAVYHSPDLPPLHSYVAFYRWITRQFEADALIHLGKHGNLEWLPGRCTGLGVEDWPDLLLEGTPLIYPFIVNDPGEGAQAKRRAGAAIVDHLIAPQRRTELTESVEEVRRRLEQPGTFSEDERDEHVRRLGLAEPDASVSAEDPDQRLREWVSDVEDSFTRSGLHVLGRLPEGEAALDLLQALWPEDRDGLNRETARRAWETPKHAPALLRQQIIPDLKRVNDELDHVVRSLEGGYVPPGPSGAPTRGRPDLLPTGRNFYTRDLRGMPTETAWKRGRRLADQLLERHRSRTGEWPRRVGVVLWGTSNMRTGGEDVAQVLALTGMRPVRADSGRVEDVEPIDPERLGRPRVDVMVRISGFFRDAFPNLVDLLVSAVNRAETCEGTETCPNFLRQRSGGSDPAPRIFGSRPGSYGAGLLPLIQEGNWENRHHLAEAFLNWSDYAYDGGTEGRVAPERLREGLAGVDAVTQNRDNQEHDLFDSDDYFQFHGGLFAAVESLSNDSPACYFSDTSRPDAIRVRTLREEAARVFHNRVSHPVWQKGMREHGYKGGYEMAATLDYVFGYDAATGVIPDGFYERIAEDFLGSTENRSFLEDQNPWALRGMGERLLEAHRRGLWDDPDESTLDTVRRTLRDSEARREEVVTA